MKQKRCTELQILIAILKGSNTLNNTGVWSHIELASLYTVPLSAVDGSSRLTTTSNGQTRPIESNRNGRFEFESNLEASQVFRYYHIRSVSVHRNKPFYGGFARELCGQRHQLYRAVIQMVL